MDMISDDGKRIKRIEEKRPTPSGRPKPSRIPSTLSPAILFPDTPQASDVNSVNVDSEPNEPCDDHTIIQSQSLNRVLLCRNHKALVVMSQALETVLIQV